MSFLGTSTGTAVLYAPVPLHDGDTLEHMYMTYEGDYDTYGEDYYVRQKFCYQNVYTGSITIPLFGLTSRMNARERILEEWGDNLADVDTYAYVLRLELKRVGTADNPTFFAAQVY